MRRRAFAFAALAAGPITLLFGCAGPQIFHGQLSLLDKGLSPGEVENRFRQPPLASTLVDLGSRPFDVHAYRLNNGLQVDPYYLVYERQRLVYWGYMSEFRRQPDRDLAEVVGRAQAALQGALRK